jgi:hypothetical protein
VAIIVKTQGQDVKISYKGLVTRSMHMKYASPITYHSKEMANDTFFWKVGKTSRLQGQKLLYH